MNLTMTKDYLSQLLSNMQEQLNRLESKQDNQTIILATVQEQTLRTNGRVNQLEGDVKKLEKVRGKRFISTLEPKTVYLIALAFVIALVIIGSVLKVQFGGLV